MSIRLRLTLLYSAILALTLIAFGAMLYGTQSRSTLRDEAEAISSMARRIVELRQAGYPLDEQMLRERPMPPFGAGGRGRWGRFGVPRLYIQLLNPQGQAGSRSESLEEVLLPLSDTGLEAVLEGKSWIEAVSLEGERLLVYSAPVIHNGRVVEIVQVASSLSNYDQHMGVLGRNLIFGSGIAVVVAFGAGWVLSGVVLRPIHRITQTAQEIGAEQDFGRRVDYTGPNDEIGQLATTFNTMLTKLQAAYQQVEQALHQQRQFVADVSHELRTPLTTLRGNLALLRRVPSISAGETEDILGDMVDESDRLIRLVNDLLTLARAEARRELRSDVVPIKPLIEDACRQARLLDSERMIECVSLPDVAVWGDEDALKQVLLILLDNALKHTTGAVAVTAEATDETVAIHIRDDGPGIAPDVLPHIFDRFYRGEGARNTPGVGLGLSIAKALIEAQRGAITVASQVGQGSTVTVTLPRANVPSADPPAA